MIAMTSTTIDILIMWAPFVLPAIALALHSACTGGRILAGAPGMSHEEELEAIAQERAAQRRTADACKVRAVVTWAARRTPTGRFRKIPALAQDFIDNLATNVESGSLTVQQALSMAKILEAVEFREVAPARE